MPLSGFPIDVSFFRCRSQAPVLQETPSLVQNFQDRKPHTKSIRTAPTGGWSTATPALFGTSRP